MAFLSDIFQSQQRLFLSGRQNGCLREAANAAENDGQQGE